MQGRAAVSGAGARIVLGALGALVVRDAPLQLHCVGAVAAGLVRAQQNGGGFMKIGDVVMVRGLDGPRMIVVWVNPKTVLCKWFTTTGTLIGEQFDKELMEAAA